MPRSRSTKKPSDHSVCQHSTIAMTQTMMSLAKYRSPSGAASSVASPQSAAEHPRGPVKEERLTTCHRQAARWSRFRRDSEASRRNRSAGEWCNPHRKLGLPTTPPSIAGRRQRRPARCDQPSILDRSANTSIMIVAQIQSRGDFHRVGRLPAGQPDGDIGGSAVDTRGSFGLTRTPVPGALDHRAPGRFLFG